MAEPAKTSPPAGRLVVISAILVLAIAAAVRLELWLWKAAYDGTGPAWLRVILGLSAWLFVPALVMGVAVALFARRRVP